MDSLKIALTGGVACGKSLFGDFLRELGAEVIRLDDISKQVTEVNSDGLRALVDAFGDRVVGEDGGLNRGVLREILLGNKGDRVLIEEILHPKILERMQKLYEQSEERVVVVEIPLLFEKKLEDLFDGVIVVVCDEQQQLERLINRANIDRALARKMIAIQMSQKDRVGVVERMQGDIVVNNGNVENLKQWAKRVYAGLINL